MAKGLEKLLDRIKNEASATLVNRYLVLVAEIANEPEKSNAALSLAEVLVATRPDQALSIAHMTYKADPHSMRALDVMIAVMDAKRRFGKSEVLKRERQKLVDGANGKTDFVVSSPDAPAYESQSGAAFVASASMPRLQGLDELDLGLSASGSALETDAFRLSLDSDVVKPAVDAAAGAAAAAAKVPAVGGVITRVEPEQSRIAELDLGENEELAALFPPDARLPAYGGAAVAPKPMKFAAKENAKAHPQGQAVGQPRVSAHSSTPASAVKVAPALNQALDHLQDQVEDEASGDKRISHDGLHVHVHLHDREHEQDRGRERHRDANHSVAVSDVAPPPSPQAEAPHPPMTAEHFWSPIRDELARLARGSRRDTSVPASKVEAPATTAVEPSAALSGALAKALSAAKSPEDAERTRAAVRELVQSLFGQHPGPGAARLLERLALHDADPGFFGLYLDALLASGSARKALHEARIALSAHPQLAWAVAVARRLAPIYHAQGAKSFVWSEDEGVQALIDKLARRPELRVATMVLVS